MEVVNKMLEEKWRLVVRCWRKKGGWELDVEGKNEKWPSVVGYQIGCPFSILSSSFIIVKMNWLPVAGLHTQEIGSHSPGSL